MITLFFLVMIRMNGLVLDVMKCRPSEESRP